MNNKIRYYKSFEDDFVETSDQAYTLPEGFTWIKKGVVARFISALTYGLAFVFGGLYCKTVLHVSFKNKKVLKSVKGGCFLYGNHTQPFGDVIIPALALFPKRIYTLCSPANLGIKFIGKVLTYLGALPIPNSIKELKEMTNAVKYRSEQGNCIVIYPEAHVWEYFTGIRPFSDSSFMFPAKQCMPIFCSTAVYTRQKHFKRPKMTVYIDGPFYPDPKLSPRDNAKMLCDQVCTTMKTRSKLSNVEYIAYIKQQ